MSVAAEPQPTAPNAQRLLWAGFMAILASGVGFSIRGGILGQWAAEFGFTQTELGAITGGGLTGFGIVILAGAMLADKLGYGTLMIVAFVMHLLSLVVTLSTGLAYDAGGKPAAFQCLFWGMFLFAIGNGIAESVVNPLVANLFPKKQTHYLNILHAGWPAGLVVGGLLSGDLHRAGVLRVEAAGTGAGMEISDFILLGPGRDLRGHAHRPAVPALGGRGLRGVSYKGMLREVGDARRGRHLRPALPVLQERRHPALLGELELSMGPRRRDRRRALAGILLCDRLPPRPDPAGRAARHSCPRRLRGARDRLLDHPDYRLDPGIAAERHAAPGLHMRV